ncbi:unnamed protein product [Cylindrotheca closterium]|uniref:peptidylprolyl isomerase n=1 Tax=Cylindrotheca closterium TaxID=2856 RepID=A0AAD2G009_9STRA|nr:unnamed protein product [Cylindrotheca closterium]
MKVLVLSLVFCSLCSGFVQINDASSSRNFALGQENANLDEARRQVLSQTLAIGTMAILPTISNAADSKALSEEYRQGTAALGDMDDQAPVPREAYKKLSSGVIYADLRPGNGEEVKEGSRVNLQWVLRKSNGYFVDSSEVNGSVPFIFTVGDGSAIKGVDEGMRGMRAGGVRRLLIPPSLAYVDGLEDGKPGPLPVGFGPRQQMRRVQNARKDVPGEYVYIEVQVTRVR